MEPVDFVTAVWSQQEYKGYGFISVRAGGWKDFAFTFPGKIVLPADLGDLYFTPNLFSHPKRRKEYMLPSRWLYADLDEVHPATVDDPQPTVAWESSPGRFQCMWLIDRSAYPEEHGQVNRGLTHAIGADKGGWDATQVLRIPGTRNYKYPSKPEVKLLWILQ